VLAASARFVGERWRFVKPKGTDRKIDAVIAASIAAELAGAVQPKRESVYGTRDLIVAVRVLRHRDKDDEPRSDRSRSVYSERGPVVVGDEDDELEWRYVGEFDPQTGGWIGGPPQWTSPEAPPGMIMWRQ
jgi:hypothetical protein